MFNKFLLCVVLLTLPARAEELNAPFTELGELPQATVPEFSYKLSIQASVRSGYIMPGRMNGMSTRAMSLLLKAVSPERIPGSDPMNSVHGKLTIGEGTIDFAATDASMLRGMPVYPPDKPAAMFRFEVKRLFLSNNEARVRLRFKDATHHYLLRYDEDKGLRLVPLSIPDGVQVDAGLVRDFRVLKKSNGGTTWYCNALTTWAIQDDKLQWTTDVPIEGQPKSIEIVGDVVLVTTTTGCSLYIRKDSGEVAFYDRSVLPGKDPMKEVLELGRVNMKIEGKYRRLARFIYAAVVLNDRRAIPFLIDCIDRGNGLQVKAMAVAALEKFNGNPDLWTPKNSTVVRGQLAAVGIKRVYPNENRQAEIAKWRKVFAAELD